jgi:hypothetical protein
MTYKIVRLFMCHAAPQVLRTGVCFSEAKAHCETNAGVSDEWMDVFTLEIN